MRRILYSRDIGITSVGLFTIYTYILLSFYMIFVALQTDRLRYSLTETDDVMKLNEAKSKKSQNLKASKIKRLTDFRLTLK